jgi:uncharacterized RDD family membrane protein YckC
VTEEVIHVPARLTTTGLLRRRYLARFIDTFLVAILATATLRLAVITLPSLPAAAGLLIGIAGLIAAVFVWISYGAFFESSAWQATPGKRIMGIRVYDASGARLKVGQAAIRNLVKDGPFVILGFVPGGQIFSLLWLGVHIFVMHRSPVYQAIHDRVVHSWVAAPEETIQLRIA